MSYPEPLPCSSAERLYKEAMFFYEQYEKKKAECEDLKKKLQKMKNLISVANAMSGRKKGKEE